MQGPREGIMRQIIKKVLLFGFIYFWLRTTAFGQSKEKGGPDGADAIYEQGRKLMHRGQFQDAKSLLEKSLQTDPSDPKLHELLGDTFEQLRDSYRAIEAYTEALKREPQRFSAYDKRGHLYSQRRDWGQALADYNMAIQLRPNIVRNVYNRALAYRELGQYTKARADLIIAYDRGMVNPTAYYLAELLATSPDATVRDGTSAIKYAQEACAQTDFKKYKSLKILAAAYAEAGQWDEAIRRSKQALDIAVDPDRSGERMFCELYQFHEPRREYTPELVANNRPSTAGEATMIAWVKYNSGDRSGAIEDARKAIEMNPRLSFAHSALGVCLLMENPNEAITHFNRAVEVNSKVPEPFTWRGMAYLNLGKYREALHDSESALVLDAKFDHARALNLYALASCGEAERALGELNKWSRDCSTKLKLNSIRGHCYVAQGRYKDAVAELNEALRHSTGELLAYSDRAVALSGLGKEEEAKHDLEECGRLSPALRASTEARMKAAKEKLSHP